MTYNPHKYWESRGHDYAGIEDDVELRYMEKVLGELDLPRDAKIIEVGPGYGRIYNLLTSMGFKNVKMCDFVDSMIEKCFNHTGVRPDKWDAKTLPYKDKSFDMVVVFDVLLHVPPPRLRNFLKEIRRISSGLVYAASYEKGIPKLAPHVFEHDYPKHFKGLNTIKEKSFDRKGKGFTATRKHWVLSEV